jgi:hypothetical protein
MRGGLALVLVPALLASLVVGCGDSPSEPAVPTSLELDASELDLVRGETATLGVRIRDQRGNTMTAPEGFEITWETSNQSVASVSDGEVTADAVGRATITARGTDLPAATATIRIASPDYEGMMAFDYENGREGSFQAAGTYRVESDGAVVASEWAFSYFDEEFDFQVLLGFRSISDTRGDLMILVVEEEVTAATTIDWDFEACADGDPTQCRAFGALFFDLDDEGEDDPEIYFLETGTIEFSSVAAGTLTGGFEAWGVLEDEFGPVEGGPEIDLRNGTFSLPVIPEEDLGPVSNGAPPPSAAAVRAAREVVRMLAPYRAH